MKFIAFFFLPLFFFLARPTQAQAQADLPKVMTDTVAVTGVCKMCKARIEEAALYVPGVKLAEWSSETQQLRVIYKTKRTNREAIAQSIAKAGHDNELAEAPEAAYADLPGCCRYRDGVEVH